MEPYYIGVGDQLARRPTASKKGGFAQNRERRRAGSTDFHPIGEVAIKHGDSVLSRGCIYR
jgi:hypothetical protein